MTICCLAASPAVAEEKQPATQESVEEALKVPEGTPRELFLFINKVKRLPPPERTREAVTAHLQKVVDAVLEATEKVLAQEVSDGDAARAIEEKFVALNVLKRVDPSAAEKMTQLAESLKDDPRAPVAQAARFQLVQAQVRTALQSGKQLDEMVDAILAYMNQYPVDQSSAGLALGVGQALSRFEPGVAGRLLSETVKLMEASDDAELRSQAESAAALARRLNLPGRFMKMWGTTADGEKLDWESYRGQYVLIDFWATWCGPCVAEIPNVRKNLEQYGEKGFRVVGVNLDEDRGQFDEFMKEAQLPWPNVMADGEGRNEVAEYYGITGIPTVILVDPAGKVLSLNARGPELGRLLAEHLGEVASE